MTDHKVALIGWPLNHSLSPAMHNAAFKYLGLTDWQYISMSNDPQSTSINHTIANIKNRGFKGANITVPFKEKVLSLLDSVDKDALIIGAVNTIVLKEQKVLGYNTDWQGFITDLKQHKVAINKKHALVIGAGGAARAIIYGLLKEGVASITILNRTTEKAKSIIKGYQPYFNNTKFYTYQLNKEAMLKAMTHHLIINTSSLGLNNTFVPWHEDIKLKNTQVAYDLIYNPKETQFINNAKLGGARVISGLGMLIHQGALAFELWTSLKAPVEVMESAAEPIS